jgi:hypothetical protein
MRLTQDAQHLVILVDVGRLDRDHEHRGAVPGNAPLDVGVPGLAKDGVAKRRVLIQLDLVADIQDPFQRGWHHRQRALTTLGAFAHPADAVGVRTLAERTGDRVLSPFSVFL